MRRYSNFFLNCCSFFDVETKRSFLLDFFDSVHLSWSDFQSFAAQNHDRRQSAAIHYFPSKKDCQKIHEERCCFYLAEGFLTKQSCFNCLRKTQSLRTPNFVPYCLFAIQPFKKTFENSEKKANNVIIK